MGMKIVVSDEFGATVAEYSTAGDEILRGSRVRLHGLKSATILNDAIGRVTAAAEDGRYPVQVLEPLAAVTAHPKPVGVKAENMELLPAPPGQPGSLPSLHSTTQSIPTRTIKIPSGPPKRSRYQPRASASDLATLQNRTGPGPVRRTVAEDAAEALMDAIWEDECPCAEYEKLLGTCMPAHKATSLQDMEVGHLMVQAWQAVKEGYFILRLKRIGFYMKEHGTPAAEPVMGRTEIRFKAEVAHALRQGSLPAWFKKQVKAQVASDDFCTGYPVVEKLGRDNVYLQELVRRDFQGIPWA